MRYLRWLVYSDLTQPPNPRNVRYIGVSFTTLGDGGMCFRQRTAVIDLRVTDFLPVRDFLDQQFKRLLQIKDSGNPVGVRLEISLGKERPVPIYDNVMVVNLLNG